jgi:hypothetical protein
VARHSYPESESDLDLGLNDLTGPLTRTGSIKGAIRRHLVCSACSLQVSSLRLSGPSVGRSWSQCRKNTNNAYECSSAKYAGKAGPKSPRLGSKTPGMLYMMRNVNELAPFSTLGEAAMLRTTMLPYYPRLSTAPYQPRSQVLQRPALIRIRSSKYPGLTQAHSI